MTYKGWKLTNTITFVKNKRRNMSYIVDPDNKQQFENATHWLYKDDSEIFTTENDGFTLKIVADAIGSSQGGKLSFWTVEATKGDFSSYVGMDSEALCNLIKTTTFINGVCQSNLVVAFHNGKQIFVAKNSEDYKIAKEDTELKASVQKRKKTTKHQVGKVYSTLTENDVYLFNCYVHYDLSWKREWSKSYVILTKLPPKKVYSFEHVNPGDTAKDILNKYYRWHFGSLVEKLPARYENNDFDFTYDLTQEDLINYEQRLHKEALDPETALDTHTRCHYLIHSFDENYELSKETIDFLTRNYNVIIKQ